MQMSTIRVTLLAATALLVSTGGLAQKAAKSKDDPAQAEIKRGKELYKKHCEICHYAEAEAIKMAPGMKGIYKKGKFTDGKKVDDASMRAWIEKGGPKMPPFRDTLNDQQITQMIAYIRTL